MLAGEWLVLRADETVGEWSARRFSSSEEAQAHLATLVESGASTDSIRLYSANSMEFAVSYKPVVNLSGDPAEHDEVSPPADNTPLAPQGSRDGVRLSSMFKTD